MSFLTKLFKIILGSRNQRVITKKNKIVASINQFQDDMASLSTEDLAAKTQSLQKQLESGKSLDDILPEAFAVVREASKRTLGLSHFDVQFIGGMVLHDGNIAEMKTGEGKTLCSTLPIYLNALTGKGVHVVTVNDYLAKRDADWMRPIYEMLGLTVGVVLPQMEPAERREAYLCDITYGTNNEFGFDYLRDNMALSLENKVQRELNYAIVDEVDSILIDEARTPLIISGPMEHRSDMYQKINEIIPRLDEQERDPSLPIEENAIRPGDYYLDEKSKQAHLTDAGYEKVETILIEKGVLGEGDSLYMPANVLILHHVNAALRAHKLFQRDVDYIVHEDKVIIVDEHTGRTMQGRRWSDGLHQAVEAKEGVNIESENQTLASITLQNYFRLYNKLAGMTGTADTEASEFHQIYGLEVIVIPTNRVMQREDADDAIYLTQEDKYQAVIEDIQSCQKREQPVLVGTASIEASEYLSAKLTQLKITHRVLNAKFHEQEAEVIAEAGRPGSVTIATNMAGRGTDIVLGGCIDMKVSALGDEPPEVAVAEIKQEWQKEHDKVVAAGGLHVIGSERHESRRIDNQLRGRSGRQGDPGSSHFYLSLQDDLMRIFASDRVSGIMQKLGLKGGTAIDHPWVTRIVRRAQEKVEMHNFDIRKNLLEYDNVANEQRQVIYVQRNEYLEEDDLSDVIKSLFLDVIASTVAQFVPLQSLEEEWDIPGLQTHLREEFNVDLPLTAWLQDDDSLNDETLADRVYESMFANYQEKEAKIGHESMRQLEKSVILQVVDALWREHLAAMDHLRKGIHLRGYAQKNPKQEYKREAYDLFTVLIENIKRDTVTMLCRVEIQSEEEVEAIEAQRQQQTLDSQQVVYEHNLTPELNSENVSEEEQSNQDRQQPQAAGKKVGRNESCPCGSGKKFKHCHGTVAANVE